MKRKRGRPTRLNAELTKQICDLLSEGISITATCGALGVNQDSYFDWLKKDAEFSEKTTRARANGKIALVRRILAEKDWRALSWYLSVCWANEFGRTVERPLPPRPPEPPPDLSKSIRVTCYGAPDVDLMQFMEMKAKLEAAGVKTDFPFRDSNNELPDHQTEQSVEPIDNGADEN